MKAGDNRSLLLAGVALGALFSCARLVAPPASVPVTAPPVEDLSLEEAEPDGPSRPPEPLEPSVVAAPPSIPPSASLRPIPARVRVGLATDRRSVTFPCCEERLVAVVGNQTLTAVEQVVVEPSVQLISPPLWRLQVAALRDEIQAEGLAARLGEALGLESGVVFDAGEGLYRVRIGSFESREDAEAQRRALSQRNIHDAWVVSEQAELRNPQMKLRQGDRQWLVRGRWLAFESNRNQGISVLGRRFRGRVLVFLNDRGTLNLINEVGLDDYLRGVVPREMGPRVFDDLEALKAQAIAARSYTLRNMGEFAGEGFDICATPRCQVYGGMDAEHELSDRAVLETSGQVLAYGGLYADALYSSTCGGHTEDVEVVFPLKAEPYLKGVPCHEAGVDRLVGSRERGSTLEVSLGRRLVPSGEPKGSARDLAARLKTLAADAGLPTRQDSLSSLERREVQRFLASQFDLAIDARLLVAREDVPYLLEPTPPDWSEEDLRLAAYMVRSGLFSRPMDEPVGQDEADEIVFHLGVFLRVLEERRARYLGMNEGHLLVREGTDQKRFRLESDLATFSRRDGEFSAAPLALVPGDRLVLYLRKGRLIGLGQQVDLDGVAYDRTSNLSSWTRFRTRAELARLVEERYPDLGFEDIEVLERGVSGRVGRMRLHGDGGASVDIVGLPVRWTLDLPDTLFTVKKLTPPEQEAGWLFTGRGWGHGVGMCQVGAYGMAMRGHSYRDILQHYYPGADLVEAPVASPPPIAQSR